MTPHKILSKRIASLGGSPKHVGDIEAALALKEIAAAGYAVVPVEPTEAMIRAVDAACHEHWPNARKMAIAIHAVMVAAAKGEA